MQFSEWVSGQPDRECVAGLSFSGTRNGGRCAGWSGSLLALFAFITTTAACAQSQTAEQANPQSPKTVQASPSVPPRVIQAQKFLANRGWTAARPQARPGSRLSAQRVGAALTGPTSSAASASTATWQPLGPTAVLTPNYGLVTGRVSAVALDPSDSTGNRLYLGTTGGGVWVAQNAGTSDAANVVFTPLTDTLEDLVGAQDASISIGALTVQTGETGVILAGTGSQ